MSFPANPTNGQLATVNGLVYTYNTTIGAWRVTTQNQSTSLTINGTTININGSATITAATPNTLTRGTYLTGNNFNGSAATTWAVDATTTATASKVVARDGNGDDYRRYGFAEYFNMSHAAGNRTSDTVFFSSNDAYIRKNDAAGMRASLSVLALAGGQMTGTITGVTGTPVSFAGGTCISTDYNYILSGGNDTGNKAVMFVNGSARTADGGANGLTFRNDGGPLTLGNASYATTITGTSATLPSSSITGALSVGGAALSGTAGEIRATNAITAFYSDRRLKTEISKIENALDKIDQLTGVIYTQNKLAEQFGYNNYEEQVGLYAQDVKIAQPQAVKLAPFDLDSNGNSKSGENYLTVQYEKLVPLLVEGIKALRLEINELKRSIK